MEKKEILSAIYEQIIQDSPPTAEYMKLQEEFANARELFLKKIGEENRSTLESITDIIYAMGKDMNKQCFVERLCYLH